MCRAPFLRACILSAPRLTGLHPDIVATMKGLAPQGAGTKPLCRTDNLATGE